MIQSVFFDLDGTLTDSGPGIIHGVKVALAHIGIQEEVVQNLRRFIGPPSLLDSFRDFYNLSQEAAQEALSAYRRFYWAEGIYENSLYPGILPMLDQLHAAGKKLYICTSKPEGMALIVAEHFGFQSLFDGIAGATLEEIRNSKSQVMAYLLDSFTPPKDYIMVGDRSYDIQGAHTMGIQGVGVTWGYGSREELCNAGADALADTPEALVKILLRGDAG